VLRRIKILKSDVKDNLDLIYFSSTIPHFPFYLINFPHNKFTSIININNINRIHISSNNLYVLGKVGSGIDDSNNHQFFNLKELIHQLLQKNVIQKILQITINISFI